MEIFDRLLGMATWILRWVILTPLVIGVLLVLGVQIIGTFVN